MRWATGLILGLSLAAGAATAGPHHGAGPPDAVYERPGPPQDDAWDADDGPLDDGYGPQAQARDGWGASPWYMDGRRSSPQCACGGLRLADSFFYDAGGVGPLPAGGDGYGHGGGFFVLDGGRSFGAASSRAFATASASASVQVRGGFRTGGRGGHGGKGH